MNNGMMNNQFGNVPQYNGGNPMYNQVGYNYGAKPPAKFTQPVTSEMSRMIYQEEDQLDVKISKIDSIKNQCTHKEPGTGNMAIVMNADGSVTCRTCGETFHLIDPQDVDKVIGETVEKIIDIMQTAKLMYVDAPEEFIKQYFQCITLLRKLPAVFKKGAANFTAHEIYSGNPYPTYNGWNNHQSAFTAFNNMMNVNPFIGTVAQPNPGFIDPRYGYNGGANMGAPMYPQAQPQQVPMQQNYTVPQPSGMMAPQGVAPGYNNQQMDGSITPGFTQAGYGYINPTVPAGNGYQATPPAAAPSGNPMAYGTPVAAPVEAPAPIQPPVGQDEIQQTKIMTP